MKDESTPKLEDMKGRKSTFHYDDDGKLSYISIEESDKPFFSDAMKEVLNMPAFLRFRFDDGNNANNGNFPPHDPDEPFTYDENNGFDIPEFMRRKNTKGKQKE